MTKIAPAAAGYSVIHSDIIALLEGARRAAARSVNALMTATYSQTVSAKLPSDSNPKKSETLSPIFTIEH